MTVYSGSRTVLIYYHTRTTSDSDIVSYFWLKICINLLVVVANSPSPWKSRMLETLQMALELDCFERHKWRKMDMGFELGISGSYMSHLHRNLQLSGFSKYE
jgi:hypothetical protein